LGHTIHLTHDGPRFVAKGLGGEKFDCKGADVLPPSPTAGGLQTP